MPSKGPEIPLEVMPEDQIPYMHWGIINRHNYSPEEPIPLKRWDPLASAPIELYDEAEGRVVELSRMRGHFSYVSVVRGARPAGGDPFREIELGNDFAIPVTDGEIRRDNPFSSAPRRWRLEGRASTIINRFPAMARVIEEDLLPELERRASALGGRVARGVCLVTFPRDYIFTLEAAKPSTVAEILASLKEAIRYTWEEAEARGFKLIPTYTFFNLGRAAGGSLPRLHAQTYIDLTQDGHGRTMEMVLISFLRQKDKGRCLLCESDHGGRFIYENDHFVLWATGSPRRNYHLRFSPKRHVEDITQLGREELLSLGELLVRVSIALSAEGVDPNRNILIYQRPRGYGSYFHIFGEIVPFEPLGGMELLDDSRVCRLSPETVASRLRASPAWEIDLGG